MADKSDNNPDGDASERQFPEYGFLTDEQWRSVCELLFRDIHGDVSGGISYIAPQYPELGQEPNVCFELSAPGFEWLLGDGFGKEQILSSAILADNRRGAGTQRDEIRRMIKALENTIQVLRRNLSTAEGVENPDVATLRLTYENGEISTRLYGILMNQGFDNNSRLPELAEWIDSKTDAELKRLPNLGSVALREMRSFAKMINSNLIGG